jgi:hypothetical protein
MRYRAEIGANPAFNNPTSTLLEPNEVGYRTARLSMSAEFKDQFRKFGSVKLMQDKATAFYESNDIGGESVDVAGHALSVLSYRQNISILITDSVLPASQEIAVQIGTRNASSFLNYPAGSVVFAGCNCETIPEVGRNSIEYSFVYDQNSHYIQYPVRNENGVVIYAEAAVGSVAKGSCLTVYNKQPFPYTSNFSNLSQYFSGL